MPDYAIDKLDFLGEGSPMLPDRNNPEAAGHIQMFCYLKYEMEQAFCMVSQGRDQEALARMNLVLGLPEDIDSVHFVASLGGSCRDCRYRKLKEGADAGNDIISTVRERMKTFGIMIRPTAVLIARQLQYRRVNNDRQNQGCTHGFIFDPLLTEGMEITEWETGDWETHDD